MSIFSPATSVLAQLLHRGRKDTYGLRNATFTLQGSFCFTDYSVSYLTTAGLITELLIRHHCLGQWSRHPMTGWLQWIISIMENATLCSYWHTLLLDLDLSLLTVMLLSSPPTWHFTQQGFWPIFSKKQNEKVFRFRELISLTTLLLSWSSQSYKTAEWGGHLSQRLICHLGHLYPTSECLGSFPSFFSDSGFLLIYTLGGSEWWL